jgi:hypothetical protein
VTEKRKQQRKLKEYGEQKKSEAEMMVQQDTILHGSSSSDLLHNISADPISAVSTSDSFIGNGSSDSPSSKSLRETAGSGPKKFGRKKPFWGLPGSFFIGETFATIRRRDWMGKRNPSRWFGRQTSGQFQDVVVLPSPSHGEKRRNHNMNASEENQNNPRKNNAKLDGEFGSNNASVVPSSSVIPTSEMINPAGVIDVEPGRAGNSPRRGRHVVKRRNGSKNNGRDTRNKGGDSRNNSIHKEGTHESSRSFNKKAEIGGLESDPSPASRKGLESEEEDSNGINATAANRNRSASRDRNNADSRNAIAQMFAQEAEHGEEQDGNRKPLILNEMV